jgi:hypothetical protein
MQVEYVGHGCLSIDTGGLKILTDPWMQGPAYCGQWNLFPKPINTRVVEDCDVVLFSHGHEDHFHPPTVEKLSRQARLFFPYLWYGGFKRYLNGLGFPAVTEAMSDKTYRLSSDTSITYIVNALDSIIVIENRGRILVNVNDALHPYPPQVVDIFVERLRQRWPNIDTVFCGFGGASYFPNAIHSPGKNDVEIAQVREQLFVHAFCRIVRSLNPKVAVPFAADYVLLRPRQRWINEVRFPRSRIPEYYREIFGESQGGPQIHVMYPGDVLSNDELLARSPYRAKLRNGDLNHLICEEYKQEIAAFEREHWLTEAQIRSLENAILQNLQYRLQFFNPQVLSTIEYSLKVSDIRENPYFIINLKSGTPRVQRGAAPSPDSLLEVEIPSEILRHAFAHDWGGGAITIGYGCEVQIFRPEILPTQIDSVCVQLLARTPRGGRHWKREPLRMARYAFSSPVNRRWAAKTFCSLVRGRRGLGIDYGIAYNLKMRPWLHRTKREVCRVFDLPLLDEKFAATL